MEIAEVVFNALWNSLHKSEKDLQLQLEDIDPSSASVLPIQNTLNELAIRKTNLRKIAEDNQFSDSAFSLTNDTPPNSLD